MLHVFLLIIKIIGILLLTVIGLLLLILLTVLLVPIRYKVYAEHGNTVMADGRVSWLLHIVNARISYAGAKLHIRVKILWFTLFDNLKPKPPKKEKQSGKTSHAASKRNVKKSAAADAKKRIPQTDKPKKDLGTSETKAEEPVRNLVSPIEEFTGGNEKKGQTGKDVKKSIVHRIFCKIKDFINKIKAFFTGLKEKIIHWIRTAAGIKDKISLVSAFLKDKYNREGFQITYAGLKKLLKHILPRKLKSRIIFGTGDPCSTGQALGAMSILYSFYGDKVQIIPDFENKRLEGIHDAKGRIRLLTILIIVIKLITDKKFKRLKNNIQILKEAL